MSAIGECTLDGFHSQFTQVQALIHIRWPRVEPDALAKTRGDVDAVVRLVAQRTNHSQTLVRQHLADLMMMAAYDENEAEAETQQKALALREQTTLTKSYFRNQLLKDLKTKAGEKLVITMLAGFGVGLVLGLLTRGLFGKKG